MFPPGEGRREAFYKFLVSYIEVASPYSRVTTQLSKEPRTTNADAPPLDI